MFTEQYFPLAIKGRVYLPVIDYRPHKVTAGIVILTTYFYIIWIIVFVNNDKFVEDFINWSNFMINRKNLAFIFNIGSYYIQYTFYYI